jgi:VanZ family protein
MRKACLAAGWAWAAAIVWLSLTPAPPGVDMEHGDKIGHFAGYGLLMFWFSQLYGRRTTRIAYAAGFVALGIGLEFLQGQLAYRAYDVFDMYANALGVLLGWAAALMIRKPLFR